MGVSATRSTLADKEGTPGAIVGSVLPTPPRGRVLRLVTRRKPRAFTCANMGGAVPLWASYAERGGCGAPRPDDGADCCAARGRPAGRRRTTDERGRRDHRRCDSLTGCGRPRPSGRRSEPITDVRPDLTVEDAYAIQAYNVAAPGRGGQAGPRSPARPDQPAEAAGTRRRRARFRRPAGRHVRRRGTS